MDPVEPSAESVDEPQPGLQAIPLVMLGDNGRIQAPSATSDIDGTVIVIRALAKDAKDAYVIDLPGIASNSCDLELVREATRKDPVWWDAGSRHATDAMDLFIAGASRITMRWNTLADPAEFDEAAADSEELYLGLEYKDGALVPNRKDPKRSVSSILADADDLGCGIVAIDLDGSRRTRDRIVSDLGGFTGERWFLSPALDTYGRRILEESGFTGVIAVAATAPSANARPPPEALPGE